MRIDASGISRSALLAVAAHLAFAQSGASVDGFVVNRTTGDRIPGATLTLFNRQAVQYQAVTDSSGAFRIATADPGRYEVLVEKDGFVLLPAGPIQVSLGDAAHVQYALQFGNTRQAKLTGRVLDAQDRPLANAQVDLIAGPSLRHTTTTSTDGRFTFDKLPAGAYKLRASPPADHTGKEVATYFPFSIEEAGAQRIVVRGNADIDGFRLQTAPVFHIRGVVVDETGKPAARATVRLIPMTTQPAHVFLSFDPMFFATSEGPGAGPEEAHLVTGADGRFEFPSVRSGHWNIAAEGAPRIDLKSGFNLAPSGVLSTFVGDTDIQGSEVRMDSPFSLAGSARWIVAQYHDGARGPIDGRPAPGGIAYPIWFGAADGQSSFVAVTVTQPDATFSLDHVRSARYLVQPLPALANPAGMQDGHVEEYFAAVVEQLNGRPNHGEPTEVGHSSGPFELDSGGWFDPDGKHVPFTPLILGPGNVRGTVEHGAGAAVVLLPDPYEDGSIGQLVFCKPDGSFEARGLHFGKYYIGAYQGLDFEGLRAPELLQRVISAGTTVQVMNGSSADVQLTAFSWLE